MYHLHIYFLPIYHLHIYIYTGHGFGMTLFSSYVVQQGHSRHWKWSRWKRSEFRWSLELGWTFQHQDIITVQLRGVSQAMGIPLYCWKASWKIPATKIEDLEVTPHSLGNPHNDVGTDKTYIIFVFFPLKNWSIMGFSDHSMVFYRDILQWFILQTFNEDIMGESWENDNP